MSITRRLVNEIDQNFRKLQVEVPSMKVEEIAFLIFRSYSAVSRFFHNLNHIFDVSDSDHALEFFAGVFHDIVYYQVDSGVGPEVSKYLRATVQTTEKGVTVSPAPGDALGNACFVIFGKTPGQVLTPFDGLNEILSALTAIDVLRPWLSPKQCLQIAVMIEATVPFRAQTDSQDWTLELEKRFALAAKEIGESLTNSEITETIKVAVEMANRDVDNFAATEISTFLDGTWGLLPETNTTMRASGAYFVVDYTRALDKMLGFLLFLKPEVVFHHYRDQVPKNYIDELLPKVQHNLQIARDYMRIKTLTSMLFEAIALDTGGDGPMSYFAGELPVVGRPREGLEIYLPTDVIRPPENDLEKLLIYGRTQNYQHDLRHAPIASYIYFASGIEKCREIYDIGVQVRDKKAERLDFYLAFPPIVFHNFTEGFKRMAPPRAEGVAKIVSAVDQRRIKSAS